MLDRFHPADLSLTFAIRIFLVLRIPASSLLPLSFQFDARSLSPGRFFPYLCNSMPDRFYKYPVDSVALSLLPWPYDSLALSLLAHSRIDLSARHIQDMHCFAYDTVAPRLCQELYTKPMKLLRPGCMRMRGRT